MDRNRDLPSWIDDERAAAGLHPLWRDRALDAAAQLHAEWLARYGLLSHGEFGNTIAGRLNRAGYPCRPRLDCSERLLCYDGSPWAVAKFLLDGDDASRADLLGGDWVDIGVGAAWGRDGLRYWCVDLARPHDFPPLDFADAEALFPYSILEPWVLDELLMAQQTKTIRPVFDALEAKQLLASGVTSALSRGVLAIVGTPQADSIRVSNPDPGTVRLDVAGLESRTFAASAVSRISINGRNGDDSLVNLTQVPSEVEAGNGANFINTGDPSRLGVGANDVIKAGNGDNVIQDSGGVDEIRAGNGDNVVFFYGRDNLVAGNGDNVIYNIVGSGTITAGRGVNRVITNPNFSVNVGPKSLPPIVFTARPSPVTLNANGTLNIAASAGNTTVTIDDNGDGTISTRYANDATGVTRTDIFLKSAVVEIGAIFGRGSGTFTNNTNIDDVVYGGAAGNNVLKGGSGFNFMKSNSPNDLIDGSRGASNILSLGGVNGKLVGGVGSNVLVAGFSGMATVVSAGPHDFIAGDIALLLTAGDVTQTHTEIGHEYEHEAGHEEEAEHEEEEHEEEEENEEEEEEENEEEEEEENEEEAEHEEEHHRD